MADDAEYEPAIEMDAAATEPKDAADEIGDANDAPVTAGSPRERAEPADSTSQPREPHKMSDKVRAMFRDLHKKVVAEGADGFGDELVPMESTDSPPAAAGDAAAGAKPASPAPIAPSTPAAVAAASAPPPAPVEPPRPAPAGAADVARAISEQARVAHEAREKALADREAALAEREKRMPDRTALIERPGATLMAYVKDVYGISDDAELKDVLTDIVTELSESGLGVKLPDEIKLKMEGRRALHSIKAYKADLTREQQRLQEQRAAQEKAAAEAREAAEHAEAERKAIAKVTELVATTKATHRFLHAQDDPAGIVVEVIREQLKRGEAADWQAAAKLANDYFRNDTESIVQKADRLKPLLAPEAPAAPAKAATSPGAAPGPAATPPPKPTTAPADPVDDESSRQPMDRHERRALKARELARKYKLGVGA